MNTIKCFILISLLTFIGYCHSQESAYELKESTNHIFNGHLIEDAIIFETNINSKLKKPFATIVLSPILYPYVDKYNLGNPKEFYRPTPQNLPANVEYYYDINSREVKYVSYRWAFINKISDDVLFDRKKLRKQVERECGELEFYTEFFDKLEASLDRKYSSTLKSVEINKARKKKIVWENDTSYSKLSLEFQDCSNEEKLLPGWFVIDLIEYSN